MDFKLIPTQYRTKTLCETNQLLCCFELLGKDKCQFNTSRAIPYTQNSTMKFSYTGPNVELKNCSLKDAWSKTPNTTTKVKLEWMNESHVDLNVSNSNLYLKVNEDFFRFRLRFQKTSGNWFPSRYRIPGTINFLNRCQLLKTRQEIQTRMNAL